MEFVSEPDFGIIQGAITFVIAWFYIRLFNSIAYDVDLERSTLNITFKEGVILEDTVKGLILLGRAGADVSYDAIVYDDRSGALSVEGLSIQRPDFAARVARISISSVDDDGSEIDVRLELDGVEIDLDALDLPPPARAALSGLGADTLTASAAIDLAYDFATSDATVYAVIDVDGLGRVYALEEFEGLYVDGAEGDGALRGGLKSLIIGFENDGAVELGLAASGMSDMPEDQAVALGAAVAQETVRWFVGADLNPNANTANAPAAVRAFAEEVGAAATRLLVEREGVAIAVQPETPIAIAALERFDEIDFSADQRIALLEVLDPELATRPTPRVAPIVDASAETILSADVAQAKTLLGALVSGVGAPRNLDLAIELLRERDDDLAFSMMLSEALIARGGADDLADAYRAALIAAAADASGARAILARLGADLPATAILAAEAEAAGSAPSDALAALIADAEAGDPAAMRRLAEAYEAGRETPRSHARAYRWALLGAAAGDAASTRMRDRLAARFADGDAEDRAAWADAIAAEASEAAELWSGGLAARAAERASE